jgi:predicted metal-dependent hydrolase
MLIEMEGFSVTLQRKRIKNINLRIKSTGEVQISAPLRTSTDVVLNFLNQKYSWIEAHRHRLLKRDQKEKSFCLTDGEYVNFQGKKCMLYFHEVKINQRIEFLNDKEIHFFIKAEASQSDKQSLLTQWHRLQMEQSCQELFQKWISVFNVTDIQVNIKKMRTRWGSCHPHKKRISLNLRLIEKPLACLEYVIVHELVHLFEASHNQRFYALMSQYLPDWQQIKKQLEEREEGAI